MVIVHQKYPQKLKREREECAVNFFVKLFNRLKNYFKDAWSELKKVTWPSRKELISSTLTVLAVVVVFAVFLGVIDLILTALIGLYIK
ncbi:MAG: preprotein translocase subunit SecE [Candidatus Atribacteria bacterium ADurb.Bin276]|uniref:Protein translocase subunit SecE n=1 Tax=Candidatus Atribacter allofermentans TaxID=1852833 RepID=A0A1V5SKV1_9BACT|nr:MAG: preprotein translocase subunit SecE [Candidatus Atribacteria bacterium ADurb.Bin276]